MQHRSALRESPRLRSWAPHLVLARRLRGRTHTGHALFHSPRPRCCELKASGRAGGQWPLTKWQVIADRWLRGLCNVPHLTPQECRRRSTAITGAIINLTQVLTGRYDSTVLTPQGGRTITSIEPPGEYVRQRAATLRQTNHPGKATGDATVRAWNRIKGNFLEGLALLASLHGSESTTKQRTKLRLLGSNAQLPIVKNGEHMFLWTQHRITDTHSGLNERPDILHRCSCYSA